jgi:nitrite reductase/ring-hydroxylating ferredoxin subunit
VTRAPKDGHTLAENPHTQPLGRHRAFNNHEVITEGWYPVCPSRALARGKARSFRIGWQRLALYRGDDRKVRALDAFCPHMGADLGNGRVVGDQLECYFHQWRFDERGACSGTRCGEPAPAGARLASYPVAERYGFIWVYSAETAAHPLPSCPGLEGQEVEALHLGRVRLYAHHHAMMAGGVDLQHFASVHDLDIEFALEVAEREPGVADWNLRGELPRRGLRALVGRLLLGDQFGYSLRFAGGSIAAISYGKEQRLAGRGRPLPSLHILWGCLPQEDGVSEVEIFALAPRRPGLLGRARALGLLGLTVALLAVLEDDDKQAYPHMRFNPKNLLKADRSVGRFMQYANGLPISPWSHARVEPDRRIVPLRTRPRGDRP